MRSLNVIKAILLFIFLLAANLLADDNSENTTDPLKIPAPTLAERMYGLSLLWSEAKFSFAFFDQVPDLDWDAEYQKYIPRIQRAETMYQYYRELQSFMALLSDGHTGVNMPPSIKMDIVPLWVTVIDGRYFIHRSTQQLIDQVPVGSEITAINGIDVKPYVATEIAPYIGQSSPQARDLFQAGYMLGAATGEFVDFSILTPDGEQRDLSVKADYFYGPDVEPIPPRASGEINITWIEDGIAMVPLNTFADKAVPDQFAALIPELTTAKAIILDLRSNGGGMTGIASSILKHFTDRDLVGSKWSTREHLAANRVWGAYGMTQYKDYGELNAWTEPEDMSPIKITEAGKLADIPFAILTSVYTASSAEDFLIYADSLAQATRIGQPTMGTTGQPLPLELPGGGNARICTKRDTWPDGTDFVGVGVIPDIYVPKTLEDIISGNDSTLNRAVDHLRQQISMTTSVYDLSR